MTKKNNYHIYIFIFVIVVLVLQGGKSLIKKETSYALHISQGAANLYCDAVQDGHLYYDSSSSEPYCVLSIRGQSNPCEDLGYTYQQQCSWTYFCFEGDGIYEMGALNNYVSEPSCNDITKTYPTKPSSSTLRNDFTGSSSGCTSDSQCSGNDICLISTGQCMSKCEVLTSNGGYTNCVEHSGGVCSEDDRYYCSSGNLISAKVTSTGEDAYFCYLSGSYVNPSFSTCPNGCSNGACQSQVCTPNAEWCEGDLVKSCSSDGLSIITQDTCNNNNEVCQELSSTNAQCVGATTYYCKGQVNCFTSSSNTGSCYTTLQACEQSFCGDNVCAGSETVNSCSQDCSDSGTGGDDFPFDPIYIVYAIVGLIAFKIIKGN